jgi:hypothetical protein
MPEKKSEPVAPAKPKKLSRTELSDELEQLKAQGNPNPERLAELKQLLAEA